jgi:hypothetical protein
VIYLINYKLPYYFILLLYMRSKIKRSLYRRSLKKRMSGGKRRKSNSNNKHNTSGIKMLSLPKKPSFAVKLGAYMLEGLHDDIFFSKTAAFSGKHNQVAGVLPFLHMNIKENEFRSIISANSVNLGKQLAKVCNKKNLNKKLSKVNFNCNKQSHAGILALNMGLVDSINNRYHLRKNGQKKLAEIYSYQSWQHGQPDSKIPASSLNYAK